MQKQWTAATKAPKIPTFMKVSERCAKFIESITKNILAATMAMEMIQNEMATPSLGLRKP